LGPVVFKRQQDFVQHLSCNLRPFSSLTAQMLKHARNNESDGPAAQAF
jgi:hypothetical protein